MTDPIASYQVRVHLRVSDDSDTPPPDEPRVPTIEALTTVVVEAVEASYPYLRATATGERLDK